MTQQGALSAVVSVPASADGLPDYDGQVALARKYDRVAGTKETLRSLAERLSAIELALPFEGVRESFRLDRLFDLHRGKSEYTKSHARSNPGTFPLYTAATRNVKPDMISSWAFDVEALHYTTEGAHAGTVFHRLKHKFSMSGHAGILVRKSEQVDYRYAFHAVSAAFREQGFRWSSHTPSNGRIAGIELTFPVDRTGELDLLAQQQIASRLDLLAAAKVDVEDRVRRLILSEIVVAPSP